jgi:hypothetical protein
MLSVHCTALLQGEQVEYTAYFSEPFNIEESIEYKHSLRIIIAMQTHY